MTWGLVVNTLAVSSTAISVYSLVLWVRGMRSLRAALEATNWETRVFGDAVRNERAQT
jgi:hypothetical protein